jgi:hypothetical protein
MWKLSADGRLDHWKAFRSRISSYPFEQALVECHEFWQRAPFTPFYLDYRNKDDWPDPWQLIYENYYCDLAKALGIVYTLHLSMHGSNLDLGIHVCQDTSSRAQYNLVWINQGKYVLNFITDEIVNRTQVPSNLKILFKFSSEDLNLANY